MSTVEAKPFKTPQAALVFAFNYSLQQQDRPLMDRMASPAARTGQGLSGMDGAGQAGMIRQELNHLTDYECAAITARFAPRNLPCSCRRACCSGYALNAEWDHAIATLTEGAMQMLTGRLSHHRMRRRIVESMFGVKVVMKDLAEQCGVAQNTVTEHKRLIKLWIAGEPAKHRAGKEHAPAIDGVETLARKKIDTALSDAGIFGADHEFN